MTISFTPQAMKEIEYWKKKDPKKFAKIKLLITAIQRDPYKGIGKPEPLRHNLTGKWSRQISKEHRLVYEIKEARIIIHQCRFHY